MKYAVIKNGSQQIRVQSGKSIWIDKIDTKIGEVYNFEHVIALNDGGKLHIGHPKLNASVKGIVQKHGKGPKLIIFRTKAKSNWKRKQGHRQDYTRILITDIILNDEKIDTIKSLNVDLEAIDGIEKEKISKNNINSEKQNKQEILKNNIFSEKDEEDEDIIKNIITSKEEDEEIEESLTVENKDKIEIDEK
ncbi:MAG: hypothetical protein HPAVJP_3430 [Candidatus Hepatoplasma vulgare]|nr:MAG: hypothetical protein HPAVJP_3430 [Candidatus Hepatoplasma sp.]